MSLSLSPDATAAPRARRFLRSQLPGLPQDSLDTVLLLGSELVSNAVRHGSGQMEVRVQVLAGAAGPAVRVGVADDGPGLPQLSTAQEYDGGQREHGRGILLLESLATRWGVDVESPGKFVWFELEVPNGG